MASHIDDITCLASEGKSTEVISAFLWISFQSKVSPSLINDFIVESFNPLASKLNDIKELRDQGYTWSQIAAYIKQSLGLTVSLLSISKILNGDVGFQADVK